MATEEPDTALDDADADAIRELAREKGFVAERALRPRLWRLIRPDGTPALDPVANDTGFTFDNAIDFLNKAPSERY